MSHDGCIEVAWKGNAFPYLIHHPNSFLQTENYGTKRQAEAGGHSNGQGQQGGQHGSDSMAQAGTGTWNGPAPRGYIRDGVNMAAPPKSAEAAATREPDSARVGPSCLLMPMLGLGTAQITSPDAIKTALDLGYRHIDCASTYGNQELVGAGIAEFIASGRRSELFMVSKLWMDDRKPEKVKAACQKTLSQLGCEYLDLYLIHWPEAMVPGSTVPWSDGLEEDKTVSILDTWRAMEELVDAGLVKAIGVSNFSVKEVEELLAQCRIRPAVNQVELHPMLPQRKLIGVCFRKGVQCVAYCPLGGQNYTGVPASELLSHPVVAAVAKEAGKTPAQVLLRWSMQRGVPVIAKSSSPERLKENIQGAFEWRLTSEQKSALDALESGVRFCAPKWKQWADPEDGGVTKPSLAMA